MIDVLRLSLFRYHKRQYLDNIENENFKSNLNLTVQLKLRVFVERRDIFILEEPISSDEYFMNIETETNIRCLKAGTDETLSRKGNKVCQFYKKQNSSLFTLF